MGLNSDCQPTRGFVVKSGGNERDLIEGGEMFLLRDIVNSFFIVIPLFFYSWDHCYFVDGGRHLKRGKTNRHSLFLEREGVGGRFFTVF